MGRPINPSKIGQGTGKIRCTAYRFTGASEATAPAAYITKQVSTSKFTVTDGTTTETLVLSDLAQGALTAGTFIVEGVLDDKKKLISEINTDKVNKLIKNETIFGGMIPKIKNCLDVANNGVKGVVIIDGRKNHSILFELLSKKGSGSLIRK